METPASPSSVTPPQPSSNPSEIGQRIGPYELVETLGEGGFGTVFVAEQSHPIQRRVALKLIKAGMDTKAVVARFESERQALALMEHPNIARLLDARLTDFIEESLAGITFKLRFLRFNQRHHTVAIAASQRVRIDPFPTRVQHINSEVSTLDDLLATFMRMRDNGFDISLSIGQHTNDRAMSFYAKTPSGFDWEIGWNPIMVNEDTWEPSTHKGISIWGHTPVGQGVIARLGQLRAALGSLTRDEVTVPEVSGAGVPA